MPFSYSIPVRSIGYALRAGEIEGHHSDVVQFLGMLGLVSDPGCAPRSAMASRGLNCLRALIASRINFFKPELF